MKHKRVVVVTLLFLLVCSFLSCKSNETSNSIPIIKQEEMFEILKEKYYVLIYLNGCLACRDCKHRINKMDKDLKEDFYYLDLELNKELSSSYFVSNIPQTTYKDLKIKKTPTLLVIENGSVKEEYIKQDSIFVFLDILENRV